MADPFQELDDALGNRLGTEAVLRPGTGTEATVRAVMHKGTAISGDFGEVVARRDMIGIPSSALPKINDTLTANGTNYILDALDSDDGYEARFFLRRA